MSGNRVFFILLILCIPMWMQAQGSKLDSLYNRQRRLERDLALTTVARDSTRQRKESTLTEMQLIHKQVVLRELLIQGMGQQISELDRRILETQTTIASLEADIARIQESFGRLMVVIYKSLHQKSPSFYLLSAENLSQGYRRLQYFKAIAQMQESQMKLIRRTKAFLAMKKLEMEQSKVEKQRVAEQEKIEKERLAALKDEQKALYENFRKDELRLNKQLQDTQGALASLKTAIKGELDRIAAAKKGKVNTKEEIDIINKLSKNFSENKGKFPWPMPMPNSTITRHFGTQNIAGTNAVMELQGIDIMTLPGQGVRAVYGGKVESVMPVPGQGRMVIVSHGAYYTVYANLENVSVKAGDTIDALKAIGTARTDQGTGETKIHFQLYNDRTPLDPETWLVRKN